MPNRSGCDPRTPSHPLALTGALSLSDGPVEVRDLPAASGVDAPPLVLLHEGLGSIASWRDLPERLREATGRRVVAWSRHGYGGSATVPGPRRRDYLHHEALDVLPEVLTRLGLRQPVLVGHSDGASIALIHAGAGAATDLAGIAAFAPHVVVEDVTVRGVAAARDAYLQGPLRERLAGQHQDVDATFWGWNDVWLSRDFRTWDITGVLPDVTCPVLLVQGVDDPYGTMRQLDLIQRGVAGPVTRVELDDCGHAPHLDQPERTMTALLDWLP